MAEIIAGITVTQILSASLQFLQYAWDEYGSIEERRSQCKVILQRCQELYDEVSSKSAQGQLPESSRSYIVHLERACSSIHEAISKIARKSFAWRLMHKDAISQAVSEAESAMVTACNKFNISAHLTTQHLQEDLARARESDYVALSTQLKDLSQSHEKILSALQNDGRQIIHLQELMIAFTKHVQSLSPSTGSNDPRDAFVQTATYTLQRLSGTNGAMEIPKWSVTSLEVIFDRHNEDSCVGRGGFGRIYKGDWHGIAVAVKEMHPEDAKAVDRRKIKEVLREIDIWSNLAHPHVLPFYGACLEASQPFMVTKLCSQGNSLEFLRSHPTADRVTMLHEISLGMNYLHIKSVVHADLKAANVLIGDDGKALIADFGLSQFQDRVSSNISVLSSTSSSSSAGSLRWMAPEQLAGLGQPPSSKSDVYSFGLTAWELYTDAVPFARIPNVLMIHKVVERKERPLRPDLLADDTLWELIQACWLHDAMQRPTFELIQTRLKSIPKHSNSSFVLPRPLRDIEAPRTPIKSGFLDTNLLSPMQALPPGPSTPLLHHFNSLSLSSDGNVSPSPDAKLQSTLSDSAVETELSSLCDRLDCSLDPFSRLNIMHSVLRMAGTEQGRHTIANTPRLYPHMKNILDSGSSDGKEVIASCLMNLAVDVPGKKAILQYPGFIPSLINLLWHGSSTSKGNAAWCIGRLAMSGEAQATLMQYPGLILALGNLLHPWSSQLEKEQSARCFACLSCNNDASDEILSKPNIVPALLECVSHASPATKMNTARTLANVATGEKGRTVLLSQPRLIFLVRSLLTASAEEIEQAVRCLQYIAFDQPGQLKILSDPDLVRSLIRLTSHDVPAIRKHAMACSRNLSGTVYGADQIYRNEFPDKLSNIIFGPSSDLKPYAITIFANVTRYSVQNNILMTQAPIKQSPSSFMMCAHELLKHEESQKWSLFCLARLIGDNTIKPGSAFWMNWVPQRQVLLVALANLTKGNSKLQKDAANCLASISARGAPFPAMTDPQVLDALANSLEFGSAETKKGVADYLTNASLTAGGQEAIRQHPGVQTALMGWNNSRFTHADIRSQVTQCLKNLYPEQSPKRLSIFKRIF